MGYRSLLLSPQSVIALAKASLLVYRLVSSCPVYNTPVEIALESSWSSQKCRYQPTQLIASYFDYSFFVISIHFSVEKDLGLRRARVSNQAQASHV